MGPCDERSHIKPWIGKSFQSPSHMFGNALEGLTQPAVVPVGQICYSAVGREKAQWSLEDLYTGFLLLALSHEEVTQNTLLLGTEMQQHDEQFSARVRPGHLALWALRLLGTTLIAGRKAGISITTLFAQTVQVHVLSVRKRWERFQTVANFTVLSMFLCPDGWWPVVKGFQYNRTKEI